MAAQLAAGAILIEKSQGRSCRVGPARSPRRTDVPRLHCAVQQAESFTRRVCPGCGTIRCSASAVASPRCAFASMLTIRNLKKSHGGRTLFEEAALQVNYGERVALVGPN